MTKSQILIAVLFASNLVFAVSKHFDLAQIKHQAAVEHDLTVQVDSLASDLSAQNVLMANTNLKLVENGILLDNAATQLGLQAINCR